MKEELDLYIKGILETDQLAPATKVTYKRFLTMLFTNFDLKDILNKPKIIIEELLKKFTYSSVRNMLIAITAIYKYNEKLLKKYDKKIEIYRIKLIEMNNKIGENYNYEDKE